MLIHTVILLARLAAPDTTLAEQAARWIAESRAVGLAMAVITDQGTDVATVGVTRVGGDRPIGDSTLFEIGSITKALTGTLLADMVLRGEVALDDPVERYLPGWRVPQVGDRPITLLDLASQSSGLPRMPAGFNPADLEDPYVAVDTMDLRTWLASTTPARAPGVGYEYSNFGFAVLGEALSVAAGQPWWQLVRDRVLLPLGMHDTWLDVPGQAMARRTDGHNDRLMPVPWWHLGAFSPAGGLKSTLADMTRLAGALRTTGDSPVMRALALATTPQRPIGNGVDSVALGWHILHRGGARIVWHNGGTGGFRTWVGADRDHGRAAVVLDNAMQGWVDAVGASLVDRDTVADPPVVTPVRSVPVAAATLEPLVGRYQLAPTAIITISHEAATLYLQLTGQPRIRMVATGPDAFAATVVDASITFERDASGAVTALVLHQNGRDLRSPRQP